MPRIRSMAPSAAVLAVAAVGIAGADEKSRGGAFAGVCGHVVSGKVGIVKVGGGCELRLSDNFSFDGAPDARVGGGKDGSVRPANRF